MDEAASAYQQDQQKNRHQGVDQQKNFLAQSEHMCLQKPGGVAMGVIDGLQDGLG